MPDPDYADFDTLSAADALAGYLRTVSGLAGIDIIVGRQKDLKADIDTAVAKAKGAAVLISMKGWDDIITESARAYIDIEHTISIWTTPILNKRGVAGSIVLGLLISALHRYAPDPDDPDTHWRTFSGGYVEHPTHRVYAFPAFFELTLPAVTLVEPAP